GPAPSRHDDASPHRGPARSRRVEVHPGHPVRHPGAPDQLVLQPAERGPRRPGAAAGDVRVAQAAVHRPRGDQRRQDDLPCPRAGGRRRRGAGGRI
ncbi:MAG: DNA-directed RNA polymerase omega subunit, partial [uncultured Acidimicrobiales bacterium]